MKKYVTKQNIAALARIAVLCALAFLSVGLSPAFAATLSRSVDLSATLAAVWSMIGPLGAIRDRSAPFDTCARGSMEQIISLL
jgi:hypothetical protein